MWVQLCYFNYLLFSSLFNVRLHSHVCIPNISKIVKTNEIIILETVLVVDLSTDTFIILMMFYTLMGYIIQKRLHRLDLGSWKIIFLNQAWAWFSRLVEWYNTISSCKEENLNFYMGKNEKFMVNFLFPRDYDEIFFYTSYGYRLKEFT